MVCKKCRAAIELVHPGHGQTVSENNEDRHIFLEVDFAEYQDPEPVPTRTNSAASTNKQNPDLVDHAEMPIAEDLEDPPDSEDILYQGDDEIEMLEFPSLENLELGNSDALQSEDGFP